MSRTNRGDWDSFAPSPSTVVAYAVTFVGSTEPQLRAVERLARPLCLTAPASPHKLNRLFGPCLAVAGRDDDRRSLSSRVALAAMARRPNRRAHTGESVEADRLHGEAQESRYNGKQAAPIGNSTKRHDQGRGACRSVGA